MTREEAISKAKGYLTDYLPSDKYEEVEEIMNAVIESAYKTGYEMGRSITMIESVR